MQLAAAFCEVVLQCRPGGLQLLVVGAQRAQLIGLIGGHGFGELDGLLGVAELFAEFEHVGAGLFPDAFQVGAGGVLALFGQSLGLFGLARPALGIDAGAVGGRGLLAISRTPARWALSSAISSRSANDRYRPEGGLSWMSGMPPLLRNHREPTGPDTPHATAASSLVNPSAIFIQNARSTFR